MEEIRTVCPEYGVVVGPRCDLFISNEEARDVGEPCGVGLVVVILAHCAVVASKSIVPPLAMPTPGLLSPTHTRAGRASERDQPGETMSQQQSRW